MPKHKKTVKKSATMPVKSAKHGAHASAEQKQELVQVPDTEPADREDPLAEYLDPEVMPWQPDDERIILDESEDPGAPRSI